MGKNQFVVKSSISLREKNKLIPAKNSSMKKIYTAVTYTFDDIQPITAVTVKIMQKRITINLTVIIILTKKQPSKVEPSH